jgi:tetratricopeptide (TPR) repeat protein
MNRLPATIYISRSSAVYFLAPLAALLFLGVSANADIASPLNAHAAVYPLITSAREQMKIREYGAAVVILFKASNIDPENAQIYQELGNCYYYLGDRNSAATNYESSLRLNPANRALADYLKLLKPENGAGLSAGPHFISKTAAVSSDRWAPAWRSALLPGWGQVYKGEKGKGYALGAIEFVLYSGVITTYYMSAGAQSEYMALGPNLSQDKYDSALNSWGTMSTLNYVFYSLFGAVYVFCVYDAAQAPRSAVQARRMESPDAQIVLLEGGLGTKFKLLSF